MQPGASSDRTTQGARSQLPEGNSVHAPVSRQVAGQHLPPDVDNLQGTAGTSAAAGVRGLPRPRRHTGRHPASDAAHKIPGGSGRACLICASWRAMAPIAATLQNPTSRQHARLLHPRRGLSGCVCGLGLGGWGSGGKEGGAGRGVEGRAARQAHGPPQHAAPPPCRHGAAAAATWRDSQLRHDAILTQHATPGAGVRGGVCPPAAQP